MLTLGPAPVVAAGQDVNILALMSATSAVDVNGVSLPLKCPRCAPLAGASPVSVRPLCSEPHDLLAAWSADAEKLLRADICLFQDRPECAFRHTAWVIGQRGVSVPFRVEPDLSGLNQISWLPAA